MQFFSAKDSYEQQWLDALAYFSTFFFRPFGALLFGYIGDKKGRQPAVILASLMMAFSCLTMAFLPTYAQIGATASWIVILCREVHPWAKS